MHTVGYDHRWTTEYSCLASFRTIYSPPQQVKRSNIIRTRKNERKNETALMLPERMMIFGVYGYAYNVLLWMYDRPVCLSIDCDRLLGVLPVE